MSLFLLFGQAATNPPQTWSGSSGTVTVVGISGAFTAGTVTWTGTSGSITITGTSGTFTTGGAPQTWAGTVGTITITGTGGRFVYPQTWSGSSGSVTVVGISGAFTAGTTPSNGSPAGGRYHPIRFPEITADEYDPNVALILALV